MVVICRHDNPSEPQEPFRNRFLDDISADEVRKELGEPPYQFEENTHPYRGFIINHDKYTNAVKAHCEKLFTWRTWFLRLFRDTPVATLMQRGRHDYYRGLSARFIFRVLLKKCRRKVFGFFKKG